MIDVIDLSKLLINEKSKRKVIDNNNLSKDSELVTDSEDRPQLDELSSSEDSGSNPPGIVVEPSLPEISEISLPEICLDALDNGQSEVGIN